MAETYPCGHPSVVPLAAAIPTSHRSYEMRPINDKKYGSLEDEPVSPLSFRSDEEVPTNREVSPLTSPTWPQPVAASSVPHYHPLPDIYAVPRRKPVGKSNLHGTGTVAIGRLAMHGSSPQISVPSHDVGPSSEARKKFGQSPRSESVRARGQEENHVVPRLLQDHADDTRPIRPTQGATIRTTCRRRPRSQSVPHPPRHQAIPLERRICAYCGRAQKETTMRFLQCSMCVNVYYCSDGRCWAERVCHNRSRKHEQITPTPTPHQQTTRPRTNPEWKVSSRPQAQAITAQRNAGTTSAEGSRPVRNGHLADLESQKPFPKRGGRCRTLWFVLAAVICLILIIIVIVIAMKH